MTGRAAVLVSAVRTPIGKFRGALEEYVARALETIPTPRRST